MNNIDKTREELGDDFNEMMNHLSTRAQCRLMFIEDDFKTIVRLVKSNNLVMYKGIGRHTNEEIKAYLIRKGFISESEPYHIDNKRQILKNEIFRELIKIKKLIRQL